MEYQKSFFNKALSGLVLVTDLEYFKIWEKYIMNTLFSE
jgi:hypothetical protein